MPGASALPSTDCHALAPPPRAVERLEVASSQDQEPASQPDVSSLQPPPPARSVETLPPSECPASGSGRSATMSTSTTEVNVTTTITRATSKAELVDENPDLAAECVQQFCSDGKPVDPQPLPQPLLANYGTMLTKLSPETCRKQELLPGPPTERVFDRDESGSVTVDVRKTLDEENVDNDKLYQHKLEGTEVRKLEEKQAMKEALQEANTFDNILLHKTLAKGQVTKKRTLVETASAKRVTTRRENEAANLDQVGCTIKRNIEEAGNAEEKVEKSEKQLENIEKVTCTSHKQPSCLTVNRPTQAPPAQ
ncbi:uncharacterized protein LOC119167420 [Rhipicephalus microplus]|uniref:uncharacterized protein LOC119167420 n=1 Tax=Rhipicephalus microplus TaxID=6941 RepID=UPI003F6D2D32